MCVSLKLPLFAVRKRCLIFSELLHGCLVLAFQKFSKVKKKKKQVKSVPSNYPGILGAPATPLNSGPL